MSAHLQFKSSYSRIRLNRLLLLCVKEKNTFLMTFKVYIPVLIHVSQLHLLLIHIWAYETSWNCPKLEWSPCNSWHLKMSWYVSDRRRSDLHACQHCVQPSPWQRHSVSLFESRVMTAGTYEVILGVCTALAPYRPSWLLTTERTSWHVSNFTPANVLIVWM
jgi:hypothetical protein